MSVGLLPWILVGNPILTLLYNKMQTQNMVLRVFNPGLLNTAPTKIVVWGETVETEPQPDIKRGTQGPIDIL